MSAASAAETAGMPDTERSTLRVMTRPPCRGVPPHPGSLGPLPATSSRSISSSSQSVASPSVSSRSSASHAISSELKGARTGLPLFEEYNSNSPKWNMTNSFLATLLMHRKQ